MSLILTAASSCQGPPTETKKVEPQGYEVHGTLDIKYVTRQTGSANDNDLFGYGLFDIGDPRRHFVTAQVSGRVAWDLDRNRDPSHPFRSADDRRSGDVTARLYTGYVDFNGVNTGLLGGTVRRARLGRQVLYDLPQTLFLDGLSLESPPIVGFGDLVFTGYGGVPSHLFESSPTGDLTGGAAVSFAPWADSRIRLDYLHVTDNYLGSTADDDLTGIRFDQRIGLGWFFNAYLNVLELDSPRDLGVFASWSDPVSDANLVVRYTALLSDENNRSIDLDYFTEVMSTYYEYDQFELTAHKGIGDSLYVEGGAQMRELRNDSKEGIFNHEFRRYHASAGAVDWPWTESDLSVIFELWDSRDDQFTTFGVDFTREVDKWSGSIGTFFELFRYDSLRGQENEDVQVSYIKLTHLWSKTRRLRLRFEYEDGETDDFFTLVLRMQTDF